MSPRLPILLIAATSTIVLTGACAADPKVSTAPTAPNDGAIAITADHAHHGMDLGPADEAFDLRFIDAMILHHEGALSMAESALKFSLRSPLKSLAQEILQSQRQEVALMRAWRRQWYPNAPVQPVAWHSSMNHMMAMTPTQVQAMRMDQDLGAADGAFDLRFIESMVVHHEGALSMAADARQKLQRPEIQQLAETILQSQRQEITQMQQWRRQWYGK